MTAYFFKEWRKFARLTQGEVAQQMGLTTATVSRIEAGKRDATVRYLVAYAAVVGCTPGAILDRNPWQETEVDGDKEAIIRAHITAIHLLLNPEVRHGREELTKVGPAARG